MLCGYEAFFTITTFLAGAADGAITLVAQEENAKRGTIKININFFMPIKFKDL